MDTFGTSSRTTRIGLLLLLLVGFALRFVWPLADPADRLSWSTGIYTDPAANTLPARNAAEHDDWNRVRIPERLVYPVLNGLTWLFYELFGVSRWSMQLLAALTGTATFAILGAALHRGPGGSSVLLGVLFCATCYWLVMNSRVLMAEGVTAVLLALASYFALGTRARDRAMAGGLAVAAALYGKFHAVGFILGLVAFVIMRERSFRSLVPVVAAGAGVAVFWLFTLFLPNQEEILTWVRESSVGSRDRTAHLRSPLAAGLELFNTQRQAWMYHRMPILGALGGFFALWTFSDREILRRRLRDGSALFVLWFLGMFLYLWILPYTAPRYFVLLAYPLVLCAACQIAEWIDREAVGPPDLRSPRSFLLFTVWIAFLGFGITDALRHYVTFKSVLFPPALLASGEESTFSLAGEFFDISRHVAWGLVVAVVLFPVSLVVTSRLRRTGFRHGIRGAALGTIAIVLTLNLGQWVWWATHRYGFVEKTKESLAAILGPDAVALGGFAPLLTLGTEIEAIPLFGSTPDPEAFEEAGVTHVLVARPGRADYSEGLHLVHWWPLRTSVVKRIQLFRVDGSEYRCTVLEEAIDAVRAQQWERGFELLSEHRRQGGPETAELLLYESSCRFGLGNLAEAERLLKRAVQIRPDNSILYMNLGILAHRRGDRRAARDHWERGLRLDPDNGQLREYLRESFENEE